MSQACSRILRPLYDVCYTLNNVCRAEAEVLFVEDSGELWNEGEVLKLHGGSAKVNVRIENWDFCSAQGGVCGSGVGQFIDVSFSLQTRGLPKGNETRPAGSDLVGPPPSGRAAPEREPLELQVDDDAVMVLSTLVNVSVLVRLPAICTGTLAPLPLCTSSTCVPSPCYHAHSPQLCRWTASGAT